MTATTPSLAAPVEAIADIRACMGVLYALAADGAVDTACMLAAMNRVEANLGTLQAIVANLGMLGFPSQSDAPAMVTMPLLTLAEVAAGARQ